jgi:hypothetical protein
MKLSVEAKVAASVATGFVALTMGVIAQGDSRDQRADSDGYHPTNNLAVRTHVSQPEYDSPLAGRPNAQEGRHRTQSQLQE